MQNYSRTKRACFFAYVAMSSVFSLPPMLFVTFHDMYGISYTLLGTLILVNFCTQLTIDLIFTFFSKHFNIGLTVRVMPLITATGLIIYAIVPLFCPAKAVFGLIGGTVIFSVAAGLCEVLISPLVAAIPTSTDKDMSMLHSLYGWGVLSVVLISSLFFKLFGTENWNYLALFWAVLPIIGSVMFFVSPIPNTDIASENTKSEKSGRGKYIFLCAVCIFLGSSAENIMTGWISSFMETALDIPKAAGDIFGMAVFALLLAGARSLYAKFGKNIVKTLLLSMLGAALCYIIAGCSPSVVLSFGACILTGFCTSMLWPGTLILMDEKVPNPGVAAYALMAACGDFGASVAPQAMGILVDKVSASSFAANLSTEYIMSTEQIGLKVGMLCSAIFPLLGTVWLVVIKRYSKKR